MSRMTPEERAALKELSDRAKAEEDADSQFVVRARNAKGIEVEYTGAEARAFLKRHGFEEDEPEQPEGDDDDAEDEADKEPADKGGYWVGRRAKAPKQE